MERSLWMRSSVCFLQSSNAASDYFLWAFPHIYVRSGYILWVARFTPFPHNLIKPRPLSRPQGVTIPNAFLYKTICYWFQNNSYFLLFTALPYFGMEKAEPSLAVGYLLFGDTLDGTALISTLQLVDLFI